MPRVRVLVIDPAVLEILSACLEAEGHQVMTTSDAVQGSSCRNRQTVPDRTLPGSTGLDLTRTVRERWRQLPALPTARSEEEDRVRGLRTGADDYVVNPFSSTEVMRHVLRGRLHADQLLACRALAGDALQVFDRAGGGSGGSSSETPQRRFPFQLL